MSFITREIKPYFERSLSPLVSYLSDKKVHPNYITFAGLILILAGSVALYYKMTVPAFVLLAVGSLLDAVDGAVARKMGIESDFGAFLDSTVDRFSDALPFMATALIYSQEGYPEGVILSFTSMLGSFTVSYTRARAESVGIYGIGGFFERTERWIVLLIGIIADLIPLALLIITLGALGTSLQRILEVRRALRRRYL